MSILLLFLKNNKRTGNIFFKKPIMNLQMLNSN